MDRWLRPGRLGSLALLTAVVAAASGFLVTLTLGGLEHATLEARFNARGAQEADERVVVIGIDEATLEAEKLPAPYPRDLHAQALRKLTEAGVTSVAYDLAFTGSTDDYNDPRLLAALKSAPRPVVGVVGLEPYTKRPAQIAGQQGFPWGETLPGNTARAGGDSPSWTDFPERVDDLDAFPVVAAAQFRERRPTPAPPRALVDYPASSRHFGFTYRSFSDLLSDKIPTEQLRGKLVVIGNTALQLQDLHRTPFGVRPGPEIQAAAIATALNGYPLRRVAPAVGAAAIIGAGAALPVLLLLVLAVTRVRRRGRDGAEDRAPIGAGAVAALGVLTGAAWLVVAQVAFNGGTVVNVTAGAVAVLVATVIATGLARAGERRAIATLRRQFAEGATDLIDRALAPDFEAGLVGELAHLLDGITLVERRTNGRTGIVYRAQQDLIDREIAVKIIRPSLVASDDARVLFQTEARALGRLWHPHVVPVFEVGDDRDIFYIAMRWIGGGDVADLRAPLEPAAAVELLTGIGSALDAAHAAGIIHGDVKPDNILLDPEQPGHAYLIDFGIALLDAADAPAAGLAPHYASPEASARRSLTPRSDIYSLGVLAFYLLSGELPFEGDEHQLAAFHAADARPVASDYNGALPPAVDAVLHQALAVEPADRQPAAGVLVAEIAAALDVETVPA
jgi:CHASE2 domain-containing sensor protein